MKLFKMLSMFLIRLYGLFDRLLIIPFVDFDTYFSIQKRLGFPLKRFYFKKAQGYSLNLDNPSTFNEKIVYRQLFERDPLLVQIADKYAVREYVEERIGEKYLIPLLQVAESYDTIDFTKLPDKYILKINHASGENIIFKHGKNNFTNSKRKLKKTIDRWLSEKYRFQQMIWFVQDIPRKIIIEKLLEDKNGKIPKDYKFFVFDGKVEFILVVHDRFGEHSINLYNRDWSIAEFTIDDGGKDVTGEIEVKPDMLNEMIRLAEKLAADFTAVRVDLYTFSSEIYFGELTPCHGGASDRFIPGEYDEYYGKKWKNTKFLLKDRVDCIIENKRKNTFRELVGFIYSDLETYGNTNSSFLKKLAVFFLNPSFHLIANYRIMYYLRNTHFSYINILFKYINSIIGSSEISPYAEIGENIYFAHTSGIIIGYGTVIKDNVTIFQQVTLGAQGGKDDYTKKYPTIENNVTIYEKASVIGAVTVGKNCLIGAHALVISDTEEDCAYVGIPARKITNAQNKPL